MGTAISHAQNKTASCFVHNKLLSAHELLHVKPYRMVGNFRCFCCCCCCCCCCFRNIKPRANFSMANELRFNLTLNLKPSSRPNCNRSLSASVSLAAISQANHGGVGARAKAIASVYERPCMPDTIC